MGMATGEIVMAIKKTKAFGKSITRIGKSSIEIESIKERNRRVEIDKAWETSWTRRGLISVFTYVAVGAYFYSIGVARPWVNAIVPTIGFLLSTLTLPWFKKVWMNSWYL